MKKYAKIINEETKACEVGLGTNARFYQSLGMTEQEVEQGFDGAWYLSGYAPQKPLEELKQEKRAEINAARDNAEQGGFEYMGKIFDSDQVSCIRISSANQAMQYADDSAIITWTCQDNSTIDLNKLQLSELIVALAQHSNECHQKATKLKAQIESCTTKEELDNIKWEN